MDKFCSIWKYLSTSWVFSFFYLTNRLTAIRNPIKNICIDAWETINHLYCYYWLWLGSLFATSQNLFAIHSNIVSVVFVHCRSDGVWVYYMDGPSIVNVVCILLFIYFSFISISCPETVSIPNLHVRMCPFLWISISPPFPTSYDQLMRIVRATSPYRKEKLKTFFSSFLKCS